MIKDQLAINMRFNNALNARIPNHNTQRKDVCFFRFVIDTEIS